MDPIYIIEHLEPELFEWCVIEYKHISKIVGKENLYFTNIKKEDVKKLEEQGKVFTQSVKTMNLNNICVLDPESNTLLSPNDKNKFKYYLFGGILGDHPPKKRTEIELTRFIKNKETRNIGKAQLSTDNAVYVVKKILEGTHFKDIKFIDSPEIKINEIESTILPFSYPLVNGKPHMSNELLNYLKKH